MPVMVNQPAGRLGEEEDTRGKPNGRDHLQGETTSLAIPNNGGLQEKKVR